MIVGLPYLKDILLQNVCEVRFFRRVNSKTFSGQYRRMLCTNSASLLNSFNGKMVLNYRQPVYQLPYNPDEYNLIVTWDILFQDYRQINMDMCDLIRTLPADDSFWVYFNQNLLPMSQGDKMAFMSK